MKAIARVPSLRAERHRTRPVEQQPPGVIDKLHARRHMNERRAVMHAANPVFIPRNHLVEEAISAALNNGDFSPFESLLVVLSTPFEDQPALGRYTNPPRPDQVVHQTFCGT